MKQKQPRLNQEKLLKYRKRRRRLVLVLVILPLALANKNKLAQLRTKLSPQEKVQEVEEEVKKEVVTIFPETKAEREAREEREARMAQLEEEKKEEEKEKKEKEDKEEGDQEEVKKKKDLIKKDRSVFVKESQPVKEDYFNQALFLGDSRNQALVKNTSLEPAQSQKQEDLDSALKNWSQALADKDFKKVYLMFGTQETSWPYKDIFKEKYGRLIDDIRKKNPQAQIYIQSIIPVTEDLDKKDDFINNARINEYNDLLIELAHEKKVHYLNIREVLGENGILPKEASDDGIHLNEAYSKLWLDYLKTHALD